MEDQINFYEKKLKYEIDSWDLYELLVKKENIVVIDARANAIFENEHIPTAINLPHRNMTTESTVNFKKSSLYVIYCDGIGCNASTKGALNMAKLGFQVKELIGGIEWWKRDNYSTEGLNGKIGKVINCGC